MRAPAALTAAAVTLALTVSGCAELGFDDSVETDPGTVAPVPPAEIELADLANVLSSDDVPATTVMTADGTLSVSGDDLAAEQQYWESVGGSPDECRDVVSAPYLVNSHDTGGRLDDPSTLLATVTELDEDRYGLIQVYARQFDDTATAQAFLTEFREAAAGCEGYRFGSDDDVTWQTVAIDVAPIPGAPEGVTALHSTETVRSSSALEASTTFLQRDGIVISVFAEITGTSTMTTEDALALAAAIAVRLNVL